MSENKNKIVSHTSIYMLGDILRRGVSLIMLPIYTRYLTPEDYGVIELLSMLLDIAAILFGARAGQAVFRYYCTANTLSNKNDIITSALFLSVALNGIGMIVVIAASEPLAIAVFSDADYQHFISLYALTLFLLPMSEIPLIHIRAQQKPWLFLIFSLAKLILQLSLNIYFVVLQELHVAGVIYSAVISGLIMAVILTGYSIYNAGILISWKTCKRLFTFSLPLKIATLGSFYMTFGDRYILKIYTDLSQVGIYALGYKFGFILLLLTWDPFQKMWDAEKYSIHKQPSAKLTFQNVFIYISSIMIFIGLCISLFTKDLLTIMADPSFHSAHTIVPIIIIAYIIQAWTRYCNFGILLKQKTIQITLSEAIGVLVITVAYFSLIPLYGIHGAAWATVIGFTARFYWVNRKGKEYYNMELPWDKVSLTAVLALIIFSISLFSPENILLSILFRTTLALVFAISFMAMPILPKDKKYEIYEKARNIQRKIAFRARR